MNCAFCRDTPSPGYQCSRCGAYTRLVDRAPSNKGAHGQSEDHTLIALAVQGLADLATRKAAKAKHRADLDRTYTEQCAKAVEQPQSRCARRKMLSKP